MAEEVDSESIKCRFKSCVEHHILLYPNGKRKRFQKLLSAGSNPVRSTIVSECRPAESHQFWVLNTVCSTHTTPTIAAGGTVATAADCKSVTLKHVGSSPTLPTIYSSSSTDRTAVF